MGLVAAVSAALLKGRFDELMDLIKTPGCEAGSSCLGRCRDGETASLE